MRLIQWLVHCAKVNMATNFFEDQEKERRKREMLQKGQQQHIELQKDPLKTENERSREEGLTGPERKMEESAEGLELQMRQILDSERRLFADSEVEYNEKAETYGLAKQAQAERIVERMDRAIRKVEQAQAAHQKQKPGLVAGLWRGKEWDKKDLLLAERLKQLKKHRKRIVRLKESLEDLRVLGMKKLRFMEPELTRERDEIVKERVREVAKRTVSPVLSQQKSRGHGRSIWREQMQS